MEGINPRQDSFGDTYYDMPKDQPIVLEVYKNSGFNETHTYQVSGAITYQKGEGTTTGDMGDLSDGTEGGADIYRISTDRLYQCLGIELRIEVSAKEEPEEPEDAAYLDIEDLGSLPIWIGAGHASQPFSFVFQSDKSGIDSDIGVRLWAVTRTEVKEDYGSGSFNRAAFRLDRLVSEVSSPTAAIQTEQEGMAEYTVSGTFALSGLKGGELLVPEVYLKSANREDKTGQTVLGGRQQGYSFVSAYGNAPGMWVVGAVGRMEISGVVLGSTSTIGISERPSAPELKGTGWIYNNSVSDGTVFYAGASAAESVHTITFTSAYVSQASDLSISGGTLREGSVSVSNQNGYGLRTVSAVVTLPAGGSRVAFKAGGESLTVQIKRLPAASETYVTSIKTRAYDEASGQLTLALSGINMGNIADGTKFSGVGWDFSSGDSHTYFEGTNLTGTNGIYTLVMKRVRDVPSNMYQGYHGEGGNFSLLYDGKDLILLDGFGLDLEKGVIQDGYRASVMFSLAVNDGGGGSGGGDEPEPIVDGDAQIRIAINHSVGSGDADVTQEADNFVRFGLNHDWWKAREEAGCRMLVSTVLSKDGKTVWSNSSTISLLNLSGNGSQVSFTLPAGYGKYYLDFSFTIEERKAGQLVSSEKLHAERRLLYYWDGMPQAVSGVTLTNWRTGKSAEKEGNGFFIEEEEGYALWIDSPHTADIIREYQEADGTWKEASSLRGLEWWPDEEKFGFYVYGYWDSEGRLSEGRIPEGIKASYQNYIFGSELHEKERYYPEGHPELAYVVEYSGLKGTAFGDPPKLDAQFHTSLKNWDEEHQGYRTVNEAYYNQFVFPIYTGGMLFPVTYNPVPYYLYTPPASNPNVRTPTTDANGNWVTPEEYYTVKPGTDILCGFEGRKENDNTAVLVYSAMDGTVKTIQKKMYPVKEGHIFYANGRSYYNQAVFQVPGDAMWLDTIRYEIRDDEGTLLNRASYNMKAYFVAGILDIKDIPAQYGGMRLSFRGQADNGDLVSVHTKLDSAGAVTMGTMLPGIYNYEITGESGHITGGTVTVSSNTYEKGISLRNDLHVPEIKALKVKTAGHEDAKKLSGLLTGKLQYADGSSGSFSLQVKDGAGSLSGLPAGASLTAMGFSYNPKDYRTVHLAEGALQDFALGKGSGEASLEIPFTAYGQWKEIKGRLMNGDKPVPYGIVSIAQQVGEGGERFESILSATSEADGTFRFLSRKIDVSRTDSFKAVYLTETLYRDYPAALQVRAATYDYQETAIPASSGADIYDVGDIQLSWQGELKIKPRLMIRQEKLYSGQRIEETSDYPASPYKVWHVGKVQSSEIAGSSDDTLLEADSSLISVDYIEAGGQKYYRDQDWDEVIEDGEPTIYMRTGGALDKALSARGAIRLHLNQPSGEIFTIGGAQYRLESQEVRVSLDAGRCAYADAIAKRAGGEIRATIVPAGDEEEVGFLVAGRIANYGNAAWRLDSGAWNGWQGDDKDSGVAYAFGTGEISLAYQGVAGQAGENIDLLSFRAAASDVNYILQMIRENPSALADYSQRNPDSVYYTFVESYGNRSTSISGMTPPKNMAEVNLGYFSFDYAVEPYPYNINYAVVKGTVSKRHPERLYEGSNPSIYFSLIAEPEYDDKGNIINIPEGAHPEFFLNGKQVGGSQDPGLGDRFRSAQVYALLPLQESENRLEYNFTVKYTGGTQTFRVSEPLDLFDISVPEQVSLTELRDLGRIYDNRLWDLTVGMRYTPGSDPVENQISIWDNGVKIYEFPWEQEVWWKPNARYQEILACLTDPDIPDSHTIWATHPKKNADGSYSTVSTERRQLEVVEGGSDIYTCDFHWLHINDQGLQDFAFMTANDFTAKTLRIWPVKNSILTFRIANASREMISGVTLNVYDANGKQLKRLRAIPYLDYDKSDGKMSYWMVCSQNSGDAFWNTTKKLNADSRRGVLSNQTMNEIKEKVASAGVSFGAASGFSIEINFTSGIPENTDLETLRVNDLRSAYMAMGITPVDYSKVYPYFRDVDEEEFRYFSNLMGEGAGNALLEDVSYSGDLKEGSENTWEIHSAKGEKGHPDFISHDMEITVDPDPEEPDIYELYARKAQDELNGNYSEEEGEIYWSVSETVQGYEFNRIAVREEEKTNEKGEVYYETTVTEQSWYPSYVVDAALRLDEEAFPKNPASSGPEASGAAMGDIITDDIETIGMETGVSASEDPLLAGGIPQRAKKNASGAQMLKLGLKVKGIYNTYKKLAHGGYEWYKKTYNVTGRTILTNGQLKFLNATGTASYLYDMYKGPKGWDSKELLDALNERVKDEKAKAQILKEIKSYDAQKQWTYYRCGTIKGICTATGWIKGAFPLKLATTLLSAHTGMDEAWSVKYSVDEWMAIKQSIYAQEEIEMYKAIEKEFQDRALEQMIGRIQRGSWDPVTREQALKLIKRDYVLQKRSNGLYYYRKKTEIPKFNTYIDPSGYVFEAVESDRIEGVTATICSAEAVYDAASETVSYSEAYTPWEDLNEDTEARQQNPLRTTEDGRFAWDVPQGRYRIGFSAEGYEYAETLPMDVPPEHTGVYIGLLSTEAPKAKITVGNKKTTVMFSKYMQLESLLNLAEVETESGSAAFLPVDENGNIIAQEASASAASWEDEEFASSLFAIRFLDGEGVPLKGVITFPDKTENTGYNGESVYQQDTIDSRYFVKTAVFTPLYEASEVKAAELGAGMVSYSGVALSEGFDFEITGEDPEVRPADEEEDEEARLERERLEAEKWGQITAEDHALWENDSSKIPADLWASGVQNTLEYTGKALTLPYLRVYDGNILLTEKTDYTVKYANNKNAGTASLLILPKGNYAASGNLSFSFTILGVDIGTEAFSADDLSVKQGGTVKPVLKWNGKTLKPGKDYKVSYTDAEGKETETVSAAGSYVMTYQGIGNFRGSRQTTLTIGDSSSLLMSEVKVAGVKALNASDVMYSGGSIEVVSALWKGFKITYGKQDITQQVLDGDIATAYIRNYAKAGTASLVLKGTGETVDGLAFAGTKTVYFKLNGTPISKATFQFGSLTYNGKAQTPEITASYAYKDASEQTKTDTLSLGNDFEVVFSNNVNAGKGKALIKGLGGFSGSVSKTFPIGKASLDSASLKLESEYPFVQGGVKPEPVVTVDGVTLALKKDYTLAYKNAAAVTSNAVVTVKGKGNYQGFAEAKYTITQQDITKITAIANDVLFKNKANIYKSALKLTDVNGKALKGGKDYSKDAVYAYGEVTTVRQKDPKDKNAFTEVYRMAGEAVDKNDILPEGTLLTVSVAGAGNYSGTATATYRIVQSNIAKAKFGKIAGKTYTGKAVTLLKSDISATIGTDKAAFTDFEIIGYENNVNAGTARVVIRGTGDYGGTKTLTFPIVKKTLTTAQK
ncbi:MAG: hypothetical protein IJU50_05475 [Lachnospiraceae bacterium]|nr:hypothetical protein [Lachnospiraceae bacterium]